MIVYEDLGRTVFINLYHQGLQKTMKNLAKTWLIAIWNKSDMSPLEIHCLEAKMGLWWFTSNASLWATKTYDIKKLIN